MWCCFSSSKKKSNKTRSADVELPQSNDNQREASSVAQPGVKHKPAVVADASVTSLALLEEHFKSISKLAALYPNLRAVSFDLGEEIEGTLWSPSHSQLAQLRKFPGLTHIDLTGCNITKKGLVKLSDNPAQVQTLVLNKCEKVNNSFLLGLNVFSNLGRLELRGCRQIHDQGMEALSGMKSLTHLDLSPYVYVSMWDESADDEEKITNARMGCLAELTNLRHLELESCQEVTNGGVMFLESLKGLKHLNLAKTGVSDSGMYSITKFTNLNSLQLGSCQIAEQPGLALIAKMTQLTHLDLNNKEGISDKALVCLSSLVNLTHLDLSFCGLVTDVGLPKLKQMPSLVWLDVSGCTGITDRGVAELAKFTRLQRLNLNRCDQVTDEGIAQLSVLTSLKHLEVGTSGFRDVQVQGLAKITTLTDVTLHWVCARENNRIGDLNKLPGVTVHVV